MALLDNRLILINMNTGTNKNSTAPQRKKTLEAILTEEIPIIMFVQEFTWSGLHNNRAFSDSLIPKEYVFFGNKDSGFIYNKNYFNCERLDLKSSVRRSYGLFIAQHSLDTHFELPRLCLCKVKSKGPPEFELLCACWHGPHNGISVEKRKRHLRSLLMFLLMIKVESGNLPLLLGGDLNLKSSEVEKVCEEISPDLKVDAPSKSIMIWVHFSDPHKTLQVLKSEVIKWICYCDHDALQMEVQVNSLAEDLKNHHIRQKLDVVRKSDYFEWHLNINAITSPDPENMISASWHGAYDEYSDEAKEESLRATMDFLLRGIQEHLATNSTTPPLQGGVQLNLKWSLKDGPTRENIHSHSNTLNTWILSNDKTLLDLVKLENKSLKKWDSRTHHLPTISTPHECPPHLFPSFQRLITCGQQISPIQPMLVHYCPPHRCPPHICPQPKSLPDERADPNGNPVDIHLDIVNLRLRCSGNYIFTLNGYLKKCVYLQPKIR